MNPSHRLRCLYVVRDRLLTIPDVAPRVAIGWKHWDDLALDRFPCLYVDSAEVSGALNIGPTGQITGNFLFGVWGYTKPVGPFRDEEEAQAARIDARETLFTTVIETLLAEATHVALNTSLRANGGSGVTRIDLVETSTDAGLVEGFGLFSLRCAGRVQAHMENF